jgi:hypothetical protein
MMIEIKHESGCCPLESDEVDLFIGAVGYESRSTWLLNNAPCSFRRTLGLRFHYSEQLHFSRSLSTYEAAGADIVSFPADAHWTSLISTFETALSGQTGLPSVIVDVSAMSRTMIASVLLALANTIPARDLRLFVHYGPAKFVSPLETAGVTVAQPVMSELAGWSNRPDSEIAAIVGLGFEGGSALGALQYLEPTRAWLFEPHGFDPRFVAEVRKANAYIDSVFEARTLPYRIDQPVETRAMIGSLMRDLRQTHRIVFIPFGPKIFSWLCILSALEDPTQESGVWRFSAQEQRTPIDYQASGFSVWHSLVIGRLAVNQPSRDTALSDSVVELS